jgi:hypothetical protein
MLDALIAKCGQLLAIRCDTVDCFRRTAWMPWRLARFSRFKPKETHETARGFSVPQNTDLQ